MSEEKAVLKKRAAVGAIYLVLRRIIAQAIFTLSNIALARLLFPSDFGTFAVVTFIVTFAQVFSDVGFAPSLVQKKDQIDKKDLQSAFSVQFLLTLFLVILIFAIAPQVASFYKFGQTGTDLLRLYSAILLPFPLKNISAALLERELLYKRSIVAEILELFFTQALVVSFAFLGLGVFSFAWGILLGRLIGAFLYFALSPWSVAIKFSIKHLSALMKFGFPYQTNVVLGLFYGPLILLYLGKIVGSQNLGFYQWAIGLSVFPMAVPEIVSRIIFPLGARMQEDKIFFRQIVERSIVIASATSLPIVFVVMAAASAIIHFIYTDRWLPALPVLYLGLAQMGIIAFTGMFTQLLLAKGYATVMRNIGVFWAILTWILSPPLIHFFNFVGMSMASLLVSASGIWLFFRLRKEIDFSFSINFLPYFVSAGVAGVIVGLVIETLPNTFCGLVISLTTGVFIYIGAISLLKGRELFEIVKSFALILKKD